MKNWATGAGNRQAQAALVLTSARFPISCGERSDDAEQCGHCWFTARTHGVTYGDELDALDASFVPEPTLLRMILPGVGLLALFEARRRRTMRS